MAEAAQVPTFKLVLVGDGGTGKVRSYLKAGCAAAMTCCWNNFPSFQALVAHLRSGSTTNNMIDDLRQAPSDW